jgi:phage-related minor tail protein
MSTSADPSARELAEQARQLAALDRLAERFGRSLNGAFASGASSGRQLTGVLGSVGSTLAATLGRSALGAVETTLTRSLEGAGRALSEGVSFGSFGGAALPFARGGVMASGGVTPFARGGIVSAPTYFPTGRGLGLMGEGGPEAIMPLARGSDGRLGVRAGGDAPAPVTINITTPDIESFRRSEAQVAADLARAVARGRRAS